ncbi:conserved exported hypothetical protein [Frankia canadensis]|uniref:DUF3499 domain-containing protein n=1 Tax=Frankia canadensis TaxID=1836972 RepID=A0A2I2KST6_9ACTN|nr:DUF3499 domain-containing protein [Frankia canadensis]SNQ48724.1 conserved exported hypothetical protein [Frankia canadensis]SOU56014.1 conserved exported hypothetical protein [Frankia canadensis]
MKPRRCSRSACSAAAVATLTYAYAESTAVLGPLSPYVEPHSYDLCGTHADRLTVPLGWAVVRLEAEASREGGREVAGDDLEALADAVREASRRAPEAPRRGPEPPHGGPHGPQGGTPPGGRRGHLRAVPSPS